MRTDSRGSVGPASDHFRYDWGPACPDMGKRVNAYPRYFARSLSIQRIALFNVCFRPIAAVRGRQEAAKRVLHWMEVVLLSDQPIVRQLFDDRFCLVHKDHVATPCATVLHNIGL